MAKPESRSSVPSGALQGPIENLADPWRFALGFPARPRKRTRWGFATDDYHEYVVGEDFLGGWIEVQAESLGTEALLDAVRAGRFVACVDSCKGAVRDTASARFTEIGVRGDRGDRSPERVHLVDGLRQHGARHGAAADTFDVEGWRASCASACATIKGALVDPQPFFVENPDRDVDRWRLRKESSTELLVHFDEGWRRRARRERQRPGRAHPARDHAAGRAVEVARRYGRRREPHSGRWMPQRRGQSTRTETDVDRDRSGYALRAHGHDFYGEIEGGDAPFARDGAFTIELIGAIRERGWRRAS